MSISRPSRTAIASTLFWFSGALLLLVALSLGIFATSSKAPRAAGVMPLIMLVWALAYLVGGFALRKRKWGYRWWTIGLCASSVAGVLLFLAPMTLIILALNAIALALVASGWRKTGTG